MTSSSKPAKPASTKVQHADFSRASKYPVLSLEEAKRLGIPTGRAVVISPVPRKGPKD
jgi:hypothetical protein